jgi:hypothetical protein
VSRRVSFLSKKIEYLEHTNTSHGHRPQGWNQTNYFEEFGNVIDAIANDTAIPARNNLIAPSVSGSWTPESVFDTGFVTAYTDSLGALAVEQ